MSTVVHSFKNLLRYVGVSTVCVSRRKRRKQMLNLAMFLEDSAREVPERTAIVCEGTRLSYAELQAAANHAANRLVHAGISKGDKFALNFPHGPSFLISHHGTLKSAPAA